MDEISETIRKNKEISEKFYAIEKSLTAFTDPGDLFEKLIPRLREEFAIRRPYFHGVRTVCLPH